MTTVVAADAVSGAPEADPPAAGASDKRRERLIQAGMALSVAVGVVLRFISQPPLWLDEAQSVAIAKRSIPDLFDALGKDGAPPLYYLLLHYWIDLFGTGDQAVRTLSGLFGVAALPLVWMLGCRIGGSPAVGKLALVFAATNPWLIRYSSETRMYSMVVVLAAALALAMHELYQKPTVRSGLLVGLVAVVLVYTHYWGLFLLIALGCVLAYHLLFGPRRVGVIGLSALVAAAVLYLPWLPTLMYQSQHTGTPWAERPHPNVFLTLVQEWCSTGLRAVTFLALLFWPLVLLGVAAIGKGPHNVVVDLRGRRSGRWLPALAGLTMVVAYVMCVKQHAAISSRYTAVVVPLVLVIFARGVFALPDRYRAAVAVGFTLAWIACGVGVSQTTRTQTGVIASRINGAARPGDVVGYCPDQLGPATSRQIKVQVTQMAYPAGGDPGFVDWVDYAQRNQSGSPAGFASALVDRARPGSSVWLVSKDGYQTFDEDCEEIATHLDRLLGVHVKSVKRSYDYYEPANLQRWFRS